MPKRRKNDHRKNDKRNNGGGLRKRAKRDVKVATKPLLRQLDRAETQAEDVYQESNRRVGNIYDALAQELGALDTQSGYQQISDSLTQNLAGLTDLLGTSGPAGELAAAGGAFASLGASGLTGLASGAQRNLSYNTSAQRQGEVERATLRRNYLEDYNDVLDDIRNQRIDVKGDMQAQILARADELRDRRAQQKLANKEYELRKIIANKEARDDKAITDFVLSEAEHKAFRAKTRPIRKSIGRTEDKITTVKRKLNALPDPGYLSPYESERNRLKRRRRRLESKVTQKRKRIKRIKRSYG